MDESVHSKKALTSLDSLVKNKKLSPENQLLWYNAYIRHSYTLNDYDLVLKYALQGEDLSRKLKKDSMLLNFIRLEGIAFYYSDFKDQALLAFQKGAKIAHDKKFYLLEATFLNNIGAIYVEKEEPSLAEKALLNSIEIMKKIGQENTGPGIRTYRILASLYDQKKDYKKARKTHLRVIKLIQNTNDSILIGSASIYYSKHLSIVGKTDSAIYYCKMGVNYLKYTIDTALYLNSLNMQYELYEKIKDYKNAFETLKIVAKVNENLKLNETKKKISDIHIKYDTDKKEQAIKLQKLRLKQGEERFNFFLIVGILLILILIVLALFIYFRIKWKQKITDEIERIKKEQEISASKENERTKIARELHDNIGSTISFISNKTEFMLKNQAENSFNKEDLVQVKESAQEVMGDLRETLWALNAKNISNFDLADKLKVYIKKHALIPVKITENLIIEKTIFNESALAIFRTCQEIINNCNKYSEATAIDVAIFSSDDSIFNISISDNGVGFDLQEKEGHYGLRNIKTRMQEINADFSIFSQENSGTEIKIRLNIPI